MNSSRADGFNGILAHPESAMSVVLPSGDSPVFSATSPTPATGAPRDGGVLTPRA